MSHPIIEFLKIYSGKGVGSFYYNRKNVNIRQWLKVCKMNDHVRELVADVVRDAISEEILEQVYNNIREARMLNIIPFDFGLFEEVNSKCTDEVWVYLSKSTYKTLATIWVEVRGSIKQQLMQEVRDKKTQIAEEVKDDSIH